MIPAIRRIHIQNQMQIKCDRTLSWLDLFKVLRCFKVLRLFGSKIFKLLIDFFYLNANKIAKLAQYLNKFCADFLINIKLRITSSVMMENWAKPFSNAE